MWEQIESLEGCTKALEDRITLVKAWIRKIVIWEKLSTRDQGNYSAQEKSVGFEEFVKEIWQKSHLPRNIENN